MCCWLNRLILQGLTEPAGQGTWSGRSGRIKCCLDIAQGIGRRGQGMHHRDQRQTQTHTHNDYRQVGHPRHLHRHPHNKPHREKKYTGKAVRNFQAPSLLQRTPTCMNNQADTHTRTQMHKHRDNVKLG